MLNGVALAAALISSPLLAADEFSLHDVTLGMHESQVNLLVQEACPRGCMSYAGGGPAGIHSLTVYHRYQTVYFSNTRRTEVDRAKPYESATYTFGPDKKVIALRAEVNGSLTAGKKLMDAALAQYHGPLQAFSQTGQAKVSAQASLDHLAYLYAPGLSGKQFEVSVVGPSASGAAISVVNYWDFDALRQLEAQSPAEFAATRGPSFGLKPRAASSQEALKAQGYQALAISASTQASHGSDKVEVVPEQHDGAQNPPSQLRVNGVVLQKSSLLSDGMSFEGVQSLGEGLFLVNAAWSGNGCSAQEQLLLRVTQGKGRLSESFGRCEASITQNNGVTYFSYAETEYDPAQVLATP